MVMHLLLASMKVKMLLAVSGCSMVAAPKYQITNCLSSALTTQGNRSRKKLSMEMINFMENEMEMINIIEMEMEMINIMEMEMDMEMMNIIVRYPS